MRHTCLNCGCALDTSLNVGARVQRKYCSPECKWRYKNHRYYTLHRDEIRARVARNKRRAARAAKPATKGQSAAGYVYVVRCDRYYKIGATRNAKQRIARFETSYPHALTVMHVAHVNDMTRIEHSPFTRFCAKRVKGEWFDLSAGDLRTISRMLPRGEKR